LASPNDTKAQAENGDECAVARAADGCGRAQPGAQPATRSGSASGRTKADS
jgi:hypothetical protein